jgi:hypothetical protein
MVLKLFILPINKGFFIDWDFNNSDWDWDFAKISGGKWDWDPPFRTLMIYNLICRRRL